MVDIILWHAGRLFSDELPLCKCIAGNVQWCADCKMPATQINPVCLKDPYDANNDLQYRCKDCWFEVKADQTRFLCSNADILPMKHIRCPCIWPVDANTYSTWTLDALPSLILDFQEHIWSQSTVYSRNLGEE